MSIECQLLIKLSFLLYNKDKLYILYGGVNVAIVTNENKKNNHFMTLKRLTKGADEVVISSPFLAGDIKTLLQEFKKDQHIRKLTLYTVLSDFDQAVNRPSLLQSFYNFCLENKIVCQINIEENQHSKIYLFKRNSKIKSALVTSANFTRNGLYDQGETGVIIENESDLIALEKSLSNGETRELSVDKINMLVEKAAEFRASIPDMPNQNHVRRFHPEDFLDKDFVDSVIFKDRNFFIKPIGSAEKPYTKHEPINTEIHFPKRYRPHVKIGDYLICYATGKKYLLGYYEITSNPAWDPSNERWPWYVDTRCLSPVFSECFWEKNITLEYALDSYHKKYPDGPVTLSKGKTNLNGLLMGNGKIQLTEIFAQHLISLIHGAEHSL